MENLKRLGVASLILLLSLILAVSACAAAESAGFTDVAGDAWYAEAVRYCRENDLMNGVSDARFDPEGTLTRAQLATALWRQEGCPVVNYLLQFSDVPEGQWYTEAVRWAASEGLARGYGNGLFGTKDPVTQEHLALMLLRLTDAPVTRGIPNFTGGSAPATRAQAAAALMACAQERRPAPEPAPSEGNRVLIAYFSNTGNTEHIAGHLQDLLDADLYPITPETPYTAADLDYNNPASRANQEQNDPAARLAISGAVVDMAQYDVIFLGYPIWWGQAPKIISTFLESCDFSGRTIVPFCTSGSSPIGSSAENLHALAGDARWLEGGRFSGSASRDAVEDWVRGLDLSPEGAATGGEAAMLHMTVNGTTLTATLADNSSAQALRELLADGPITIDMRDYGSMEKVGPLGASLPANDEQINTQAGDIILYQGSQLVIYYDTNAWSLTRLGTINDVTTQELRELLGGGDVSVTISLGS